MYRAQFFAASRAGRGDPTASAAEPNRKPLLGVGAGRVPVAKAAAIREQLVRILEDVGEAEGSWAAGSDGGESGQETVHVNLLVGFFTQEAPTA
jgi:hypothetical protein